ncbi:MAG: class I SAM-dependent methyltransferase [Gammaproteobacteria bacterium]|nr:class I SAM-dependent methyltransferase [Gammaproteobacteria bacterium]
MSKDIQKTDGTDTAHHSWDHRWETEEGRSDWLQPDDDVKNIIPLLQARNVKRVLDLGCGVGRHALFLANEGFDVIAIDGSEVGLNFVAREASKHHLSVTFKQALMTSLPLEDNSIDYVLAFNVIYHGSPAVVRKAVKEIARVLVPGGLYQGTMLSKRNGNYGLGTEVDDHTFVQEESDDDKSHPHFYCNALELIQMFDGFELIALHDKCHQKPESWHWHMICEKME